VTGSGRIQLQFSGMSREAPRAASVVADDVRREVERALDHLLSTAPRVHRADVTDLILSRLRRSRSDTGDERFPAPEIWKTAYTEMLVEVRRQGARPGVKNSDAPAQAAIPGHGLGMAILECLQAQAASRRVVAVLHLQGHTEREIATLLGVTRRKAASLAHRAVEAVRACLEAKGVRP
jgi:RNA polymerase sigma-70 factor, ECF subfamily